MNNPVNLAYAIIGAVSVVILWTANHRYHEKQMRKHESDYQMSLKGDSITLQDNYRNVGTVHYTQLDSLILADNQ